jgi:two-component system, chemotaxis family, response regulator Rcp1
MANILLIEDNPGDILLTKEAFKECKQCHKIEAVKDGVEALKYLRKQGRYVNSADPDIILLDLNLPKKDGREVLVEIKADCNLRTIPVIILSTSRNMQDIFTSYSLKANCYITKPVELDNFIKIITSIDKFWLKTVKLPKVMKKEPSNY